MNVKCESVSQSVRVRASEADGGRMTAGRRNQPRPKDAAEQGSVVAVAVGVRACERERKEEGRGGIVEQRNECNVEGTVNSGKR